MNELYVVDSSRGMVSGLQSDIYYAILSSAYKDVMRFAEVPNLYLLADTLFEILLLYNDTEYRNNYAIQQLSNPMVLEGYLDFYKFEYSDGRVIKNNSQNILLGEWLDAQRTERPMWYYEEPDMA